MFRHYHRYQELTTWLEEMAAQRPDIFRLESIGRSTEGRDIWCMIVSRRETGDHRDKPAVWVDGNLHACELAPSAACLHLLFSLMNRDGNDLAVTQALDTRTFYVVCRANPDGAELALADQPVYLRSSSRNYPVPESPVAGLTSEDIDGDGRILTMRLRDPNGSWKVSAKDPRVMVRREPEDLQGPFYRLLPEGRLLEDYDGATISGSAVSQKIDFNRNFPARWRPESEQSGAGPYPTSEPEVRALVDFILDHPNICHALSFHTHGGVLLRPYSTDPDEHLPPEDLWMYQYLGAKGTEITGYPSVSTFHDFNYFPGEVINGGFDDWVYDHLGIFGWTVELWSLHQRAGIEKGRTPGTPQGQFNFVEWYRQHPLEDDLALLAWNDQELEGTGYVEWRKFEHPQLGELEIGGWDYMYTFRNPPAKLLEQEVKPFADWLIWQALTTPRLAIHRLRHEALGKGRYRLELVLENRGWLPTYVSKKALERDLRPILVELKLPPGARLEIGQLRTEAGHLQGKSHRPTSYCNPRGDYTDDRVKLEWVVSLEAEGDLEICAYQDRAGRVRRTVTLG